MPKKLFTPGTPKPPKSGRKKGTKDKKTVIREKLQEIRYADPEKFQQKIAELSERYFDELEKLKGESFVRSYERIIDYAHPRKTKADVTVNTPEPIKIIVEDYRTGGN